jgi:hypothetical protein
MTAVNKSGYALRYASAALRDEEEVVLAALKESPSAISYASKRLRTDKAFIGRLIDMELDIFG